MMTQMQPNGNTCVPQIFDYPFSYDESSSDLTKAHVAGQICACQHEGMNSSTASKKKMESDKSVLEMPLWPPLKTIRSAMEKDSPLKEEVKHALNYRSVFIAAVMLSMMTFGFMLTF